MPKYTRRVVIVVPVGNQANANTLAAGFDQSGDGSLTFGPCQLSPTGVAPATHLACNTQMEDGVCAALPAYSGLLSVGGQAFDVVTGQELLPGAAGWTAGLCAGWSGQQCFAALALKVVGAK